MTLRSLAPEASASANSATSAYKNLKLLLGSNPKPRWVLITLIHIYDEPESSQANKFTVVTLPEASASANSATPAYLIVDNFRMGAVCLRNKFRFHEIEDFVLWNKFRLHQIKDLAQFRHTCIFNALPNSQR